MLAKEGTGLIAAAAGAAVATTALGLRIGGPWRFLAVPGVAVLGFTAWFFRDPLRTSPVGPPGLLLAPADGKVVEIVTEAEPLYLKGPAQRVSIFLSPLNVHVNRSPADGVVEYARYVPGEYLVAWHPKASEKNERSEVGIRHPSGTKIFFKQIAGAVARRIVYDAPLGKQMKAGERYGIVKFGSRMDVVVPPHVHLSVTLGQRTVAGVTVIGEIPGGPPTDDDADFAAEAAVVAAARLSGTPGSAGGGDGAAA